MTEQQPLLDLILLYGKYREDQGYYVGEDSHAAGRLADGVMAKIEQAIRLMSPEHQETKP